MNRKIWVLSLTAMTMALSACVVAPPRVAFVRPQVAVYAPIGPPPQRVEVITSAPGADFLWLSGFWRWDGRQHLWEQGHWERQREHERWEAHRWAQDERGQWQSHGGRWRRD
ncbi:YXWGXW repeat-containing protein [Rhodoferax sp. PAMC 29310]|uniref:YXWGXW repeat-containing protein n=1 Tax=Rhodoferax sp. PAMC 29310 TaxID=2822760 RepID=UPI001B3372B1|nr:YXWGXW repeat-containing protein [Rhodoferax sp. PAMC 29310]